MGTVYVDQSDWASWLPQTYKNVLMALNKQYY